MRRSASTNSEKSTVVQIRDKPGQGLCAINIVERSAGSAEKVVIESGGVVPVA